MQDGPLLDPESFLGFLPFGFIGLGAISLLVFLSIAVLSGQNRFGLSLAALLSVIVLGSGLYLRTLELHDAAPVSLPPLICTTTEGTVGRVKITTRIYNPKDGRPNDERSHGYPQEFFLGEGEPGISINNVADIEENTSKFREKHWGAIWECIS